MRSLLLMLAVLMAITLWFRHDNQNLSRAFAKANQIATEQKKTINALNHQLAVSQRMAIANENAQVRLRDALAISSAVTASASRSLTCAFSFAMAIRCDTAS